MIEIIERIARGQNIGNVKEGKVIRKNSDGTYDVKFNSGSVKRKIRNISDQNFSVSSSVTLLLIDGKISNSRIIGRGAYSKNGIKTVTI